MTEHTLHRVQSCGAGWSEEGHLARCNPPFAVVEEDSEVAVVKAACETDMAVGILAEAEAKNFHDVLQDVLMTPMTTACFDSSAALHRTDSGALRAGCYREAITSHDVEVKGLLTENRNRIRTYPRQTREREGVPPT